MRVLLTATIVGLLIGIAPVSSDEPDGLVAFRPAWVEVDRSARRSALRGPGAELRLAVAPYRDLFDVDLELVVPAGVDVAVADGALAANAVDVEILDDGTKRLRIGLGDLPRRAQQVVPLRFHLMGETGAVATATIVGRTADGRPARDAFGIPVGNPGATPLRRHGAVEFRAVPVPDEDVPTGLTGGAP